MFTCYSILEKMPKMAKMQVLAANYIKK